MNHSKEGHLRTLLEFGLDIPIFTKLYEFYNKLTITILQQMSVKLDLLKILLRLAKDNQAITDKRYVELQALLQEIGRMLGGWIRSTKQTLP